MHLNYSYCEFLLVSMSFAVLSMLSNNKASLETIVAKPTNTIADPEDALIQSIDSIKPLATRKKYIQSEIAVHPNSKKPKSFLISNGHC